MPASSATPFEERNRIILDGSRGEGGGQISGPPLSLSLLTGRPFRMVKIRANRDKPGLRPQHQKAVESAAQLGDARVSGNVVGARELTFSPGAYTTGDLSIDIGTAGSTGLVLQTLYLPVAMRAQSLHPARTYRWNIQPQGTFIRFPRRHLEPPTWRPWAYHLRRHAIGWILSTRGRSARSTDRAGNTTTITADRPRPFANSGAGSPEFPTFVMISPAECAIALSTASRNSESRPRSLDRLAKSRAGGRTRLDRPSRRNRSGHVRRAG